MSNPRLTENIETAGRKNATNRAHDKQELSQWVSTYNETNASFLEKPDY